MRLIKVHPPLWVAFLFGLLICSYSVPGYADTLCVKQKQRVKNGRVRTANVVVRVEGECPPRYVPFSTIEEFDISTATLAGNQLDDKSVTTDKLADNSVTSEKIVDGAVGFQDLAADAVFTNTIVVSPVGNAQDNCAELLAAIADITDNTADNPYRILLEPGQYDCGSSAVVLPLFTALWGSGESVTKITGTVAGIDGVLQVPRGGEVQQLSVTNTGGAGFTAVAIGDQFAGSGSIVLKNVTALAENGDNQSIGVALNAFCTSPCTHSLTNVTSTAQKYTGSTTTIAGLFISGPNVYGDLNNVVARGLGNGTVNTGGLFNQCEEVYVRNSVFEGSYKAVRIVGNTTYVKIAHSQISGGNPNDTQFTCANSYDENYTAVNGFCA